MLAHSQERPRYLPFHQARIRLRIITSSDVPPDRSVGGSESAMDAQQCYSRGKKQKNGLHQKVPSARSTARKTVSLCNSTRSNGECKQTARLLAAEAGYDPLSRPLMLKLPNFSIKKISYVSHRCVKPPFRPARAVYDAHMRTNHRRFVRISCADPKILVSSSPFKF